VFWFNRIKKEEFENFKTELNKSLVNSFVNVKGEFDHIKKELSLHDVLFEDYKSMLEMIKERLDNMEFSRPKEPISRPNATKTRPNIVKEIKEPISRPITTSSITTQEKRIISVIIDHKGMDLTYKDISKVLHKSPNTIKNQINVLKNKVNFLIETIDGEQKKRYTIKDNIKLKEYIE